MHLGKRIGAILLMGGEGSRFGSPIPKQFHLIGGEKIYLHTLDTFKKSNLFDEIILVCHPDWIDLPHERVVKGGKTRQESSYLGLQGFKLKPDIVLIHDAVRPFVTEQILKENIEGAIQWGAVDTCIPSADTIVHVPDGKIIESIPKRDEYFRGQTPQSFQMDWILEAHEMALKDGIENASDDCRLVLRLGKKVHVVSGDEKNIKITSEFDLFIANQMMAVQVISTRASKGKRAT
jgi:2-C-methyl-D-erythritol 4-phosphate cytidylyltransferase